jgi:hypothetical protein
MKQMEAAGHTNEPKTEQRSSIFRVGFDCGFSYRSESEGVSIESSGAQLNRGRLWRNIDVRVSSFGACNKKGHYASLFVMFAKKKKKK